jgi:hypothetical protein
MRVEQQRDPLAHRQLALLARLLAVALRAACERTGPRLWKISHLVCRRSSLGFEP